MYLQRYPAYEAHRRSLSLGPPPYQLAPHECYGELVQSDLGNHSLGDSRMVVTGPQFTAGPLPVDLDTRRCRSGRECKVSITARQAAEHGGAEVVYLSLIHI